MLYTTVSYWFDSMEFFVADGNRLKLILGQGMDKGWNVSSGNKFQFI